MSIGQQRFQSIWLRLVEASSVRRRGARQPGRDRDRRNAEFLAWSFLVSSELGKFGFLSSKAHASDEDIDTSDRTSVAGDDSLRTGDGEDASALSQDDAESGSSSANKAASSGSGDPLLGDYADAAIGSGGGGSGSLHVGNGGGGGGGGGGAASGGSSSAGFFPAGGGNPVVPTPVEVDPPLIEVAILPTFKELTPFLDQFGIGTTPTALETEGFSAAKGPVAAALKFAETPNSTLGFWVADGDLAPNSVPLTRDGVSVEWLVQANGRVGGNDTEVNNVRGFNEFASSNHTETTSADGKIQDNNASVIDGQDWGGLLWVKGNYFEFNTIVQVNLVWDRDTVVIENPGSTGQAGAALGKVTSGNNQQYNDASIIDADIIDDEVDITDVFNDTTSEAAVPDQLILGGRQEFFTAIQINSIIDVDKLNFNVSDVGSVLDEMGVSRDLGSFANVNSAGAIQKNESLVESTATYEQPWLTAEKFWNLHTIQQKTIIDGNYYEFNTVIQINVINDNDTITVNGSGAAGAAARDDGILASGGNIQFNAAEIEKRDQHDDLFVGGRYSQYNLVLQLNAIDDSDTISQNIGHGTNHGVGTVGHNGTDGGQGSDAASANLTVPDVFEETAVRGQDALV